MESYLEVSFFHNAMTFYLATLLGEYATNKPLAMWRALLYSIVASALAVLLWVPYAWVYSLLFEAFAFLFFFRYAQKAYGAMLVIRTLCAISAFVFYGGGFHNGCWFVPAHDQGILALWIVYGICLILVLVKWKDFFARMNFVYEATLFLTHEKRKICGYLDSGNLLTYQRVPIIFMDQSQQAYFKEQSIELVVMNSVNKSEVIRCYECQIKLMGCRKQQVYVNCDHHLQLPFRCNALLNVCMMTTG